MHDILNGVNDVNQWPYLSRWIRIWFGWDSLVALVILH